MLDNIDKIRERAIVEIKEKAKKNPGYLHPLNKERLEDMKRLKFETGYIFTDWMQHNGIMNNATKVRQKQKDDWAKSIGFEDFNDYRRDLYYESGRGLPSEANENCPTYLGVFTENLMIYRYPGAKKMRYGNPGFDYLWNEIKIDVKGKCITLRPGKLPGFTFPIRYNDIPDKFVLVGYENRDNLNPIYAWEFDRDEIVRYRIGDRYILKDFWERHTFTISYTPEGLSEFKDHQINIDELKFNQLNNNNNNNNNCKQ